MAGYIGGAMGNGIKKLAKAYKASVKKADTNYANSNKGKFLKKQYDAGWRP